MAEADSTADVVVIGAGAAGLWAAGVLARTHPRADVLVLEKTPRTGTKILASGGTRCNLTTTLEPDAAARLFRTRGERFLRAAFRALPPARVRARFAALGVATEEAPLEKVFPASGRARDVRDALEAEARAAGARIRCDARVDALEPRGERGRDGWDVHVAASVLRARRLCVCPGGKSYPGSGTTGDGYPWLASLDLPLVEPVPALAPLSSPAGWVHALTGLAWQGGEARLTRAGKRLGLRARPLLFTHRGVSGPAAMDLSVHVAREPGAAFELSLDLFPELSREELRARLIEAAGRAGAPRLSRVLAELAREPLPRRMLAAIAEAARVGDPDPSVQSLDKARRHAWIETLKGLSIPIDGTLGFDKAEVTAGGLALGAVDPGSMAVRAYENLFVFGELLDLDGPIGGLNFQAAFACAELAGRA